MTYRNGLCMLPLVWVLMLGALPLWGGEAVRPAAAATALPVVAGATEEVRGVLREIESKLRTVENVQTGFVQTRNLAAFKEPLIITGHIAVAKPDRLAWHVDSPIRYSVVMDGTDIRQWDEESGKEQRFPIARNPVLKTVTEQLRRWFSGNYAGLVDNYEISIVAKAPLRLAFVPREGALERKVVAGIEVEFMADLSYIAAVTIKEIGGDSTRIAFTGTKLNTELAPGIWKVKRDEH